MSEVNPDRVWYPPLFPELGRLPSHATLVGQNCQQQDSLEQAYRDELCRAAGRRVAPPCCKTLHISLFFDSTGNNLNHDLYTANPKHPTNIARLFRATIGQGHAGGLGSKNLMLTDMPGSAGNRYYKYYLPGMGTPFPEISEPDFSLAGLTTALRGEDRINWALLRIIDALMRTTGLGKMDDGVCWRAVRAMATTIATFGLTGSSNRCQEFYRLLQEQKLAETLRRALNPAGPGQMKLLGIKLYIYGFSRGAAAARTFVDWLCALLPQPQADEEKPEQCLAVGGLKIPLSIEFLGLLDTVASVGVPHLAPVAEGHMGWADGSQALPDDERYGGLIKHCLHLVSAHEQRLCFPLDSLRRTGGQYPTRSMEVLYPGMHSDIGGGYPPGDQGKAAGPDDGLLLSQVALHEMYAAAFAVGAPLKVRQNALPDTLKSDEWRVMPEDVALEYEISPDLVRRFNAWRTLTLSLPPSAKNISDQQVTDYQPVRAPVSLEQAIEAQMGWLTAWRIDRYARGTYKTQPFYRESAAGGRDRDSDPVVRRASLAAREAKQKKIEQARREMLAGMTKETFPLLPQGEKDFDAALGASGRRGVPRGLSGPFAQPYAGMVL